MNKRQKKKAWKRRVPILFSRKPGSMYNYVRMHFDRIPMMRMISQQWISEETMREFRALWDAQVVDNGWTKPEIES